MRSSLGHSPKNSRDACGLILKRFFKLFTDTLHTETLDRSVGKSGILSVSRVVTGVEKAFKKPSSAVLHNSCNKLGIFPVE